MSTISAPEDYRTTALGDTDTAGLPYWVGIKVTITNNRAGGEMAYLPPTAFAAVDDGGNQVEEALWLTPPSPDTTRRFLSRRHQGRVGAFFDAGWRLA